MFQVVGPEDMVIVRAPVPSAVIPQPVIIVAGTEDIHPPVEDMRFAIGDIQFPGGRENRVLGFVADSDQAAVLGTGLRIGCQNPRITLCQGEHFPPAIHLRDTPVGRCPDKAAGHRATYIHGKTVSFIHHRSGPVQVPGPLRFLLAGHTGQQDGSDE